MTAPNVVGPSAIGPEKPAPGKTDVLSPTREALDGAGDDVSPRRLRQPADTKTRPEDYEEPLPVPAKGAVRPQANLDSEREPAATPTRRTFDRDWDRQPPERSPQRSQSDQPATGVDSNRETNPPRNDSRRAADLIGTALTAPRSGALEGQSFTLVDALARRSDRDGQIRLVHAYWKLMAGAAAYHGALDEYQRVLEVEEPRGRETPGVLTAARASAKAKMYEAQIVAVAGQFELQELLRSSEGPGVLPIASDLPHVGLYATRYSELYAGRPAPTRVRQIHQTLPTLYDAVQARAQAFAAATEAVDAAQAGLRKGEVDVDIWLTRLAQLSQHRQAFLAIVRAYNDDIADYALAVAQEGTPAADLASMLIRVKATAATTRSAPINTARDPRLEGLRRSYIPPSSNSSPAINANPAINTTSPVNTRPPGGARDGFVPRGRSER